MPAPSSVPMKPSLPPMAYTFHPVTGRTVLVRNGQVGYWAIDDCASADELNARIGVSERVARVMRACAIHGWGIPLAGDSRE